MQCRVRTYLGFLNRDVAADGACVCVGSGHVYLESLGLGRCKEGGLDECGEQGEERRAGVRDDGRSELLYKSQEAVVFGEVIDIRSWRSLRCLIGSK